MYREFEFPLSFIGNTNNVVIEDPIYRNAPIFS